MGQVQDLAGEPLGLLLPELPGGRACSANGPGDPRGIEMHDPSVNRADREHDQGIG